MIKDLKIDQIYLGICFSSLAIIVSQNTSLLQDSKKIGLGMDLV